MCIRDSVYTVTFVKAIPLMFMALYFTAVVLIAAIDKEYRSINKKVLAYGICISLLYMIYLYVIESNSIYRYAIYIVSLGILAMLNNSKKTNEIVKVLSFAIFMAIGVAEITMILL